MKQDIHGQLVFSEQDLCELYLRNPERELNNVLMENPIVFDEDLEIEKAPTILQYLESSEGISEFDTRLQSNWKMPEEYKNFDIAEWVLTQCKTETELQRVGKELLMYMDRGLFPLLQYLKYLVDTMRANKIVWGVGRGSSVSSYVLYLLGVHRVNSIYFDLDIEEFLR